jgi:trans-o-hydroxybenzylidenepyruvate hydratase-aldolase
MLTAGDISGVYVMAPTPCVEGGEHWSNTDSVDLDESARMTESYIRDGAAGLSLCGTAGECAALLWEEKLKFISTVVETARHRIPIFAGATALGTKETIRQMRGFRDIGADGVFIGLPLWQTPMLSNAVRFFADLSEAVPDMPIMVYSNSRVFKYNFPREFWLGVSQRAPTVITNKIASQDTIRDLEEIVRLTGDRIAYLPNDNTAYEAWKKVGSKVRGLWSTSAAMGPEPILALSRALSADDEARIKAVLADIHSVPRFRPGDDEPGQATFTELEAQVQKPRFSASGYVKSGPSRAPYFYEDLPESWRASAVANGKGWAELRRKYQVAAGA